MVVDEANELDNVSRVFGIYAGVLHLAAAAYEFVAIRPASSTWMYGMPLWAALAEVLILHVMWPTVRRGRKRWALSAIAGVATVGGVACSLELNRFEHLAFGLVAAVITVAATIHVVNDLITMVAIRGLEAGRVDLDCGVP